MTTKNTAEHIDMRPALIDEVYSPYVRVNRTAFALRDSHFNPAIVRAQFAVREQEAVA